MSLETVAPSMQSGFRLVPRWILVILRVHLGVILLVTVAGKVFRDTPFAEEMLGFLQGYAFKMPFGALRTVLTGRRYSACEAIL